MGKARVDLRSVTTVGLDLAKHVFQIHAVDADGKIVIATALRRRDVLSFFDALPPCVIAWRPAVQLITGLANWSNSVTTPA
jgi:transposase